MKYLILILSAFTFNFANASTEYNQTLFLIEVAKVVSPTEANFFTYGGGHLKLSCQAGMIVKGYRPQIRNMLQALLKTKDASRKVSTSVFYRFYNTSQSCRKIMKEFLDVSPGHPIAIEVETAYSFIDLSKNR